MTATLTLPRELAVSVLRQAQTGTDMLAVLDGLVEYSDSPEAVSADVDNSGEAVAG